MSPYHLAAPNQLSEPMAAYRLRKFQVRGGYLSDHEPGPFVGRDDLDVVVAMPSAGDLVIYGHGSRDGDVWFIPEQSAHAGPSREELHTFIIHPDRVRLPAPIVHPVQLYPVFATYLAPQHL
jgi:hypothetical protein